ncbi:MAG: phosphoadenosine phosphosulfate reductase family protein [Candidatus Humimicrobiaceae bacterium]
MEITKRIIEEACRQSTRQALSFSGGGDSMVLLDILSKMNIRPVVIYADSQMEYFESVPFIREVCKKYGLELHIAKADITPVEQWHKQGWPMLGKLAARLWMQKNKDKGFKLDVSSCCRRMKIVPARKLTIKLGATLQFTGQRGGQDDKMRGMREFKDGAIKYVIADKILVCNPLLGWTDGMIRRYTVQNELMIHPMKKAGAQTIGCMYCGGGAQFDNSGFKILRRTNPEAWHRFMVEWEAGLIVLAVKYNLALSTAQELVKAEGGLKKLAKESPWIFDYLRENPLKGYDKGNRA